MTFLPADSARKEAKMNKKPRKYLGEEIKCVIFLSWLGLLGGGAFIYFYPKVALFVLGGGLLILGPPLLFMKLWNRGAE
jgi:hypothetical protein